MSVCTNSNKADQKKEFCSYFFGGGENRKTLFRPLTASEDGLILLLLLLLMLLYLSLFPCSSSTSSQAFRADIIAKKEDTGPHTLTEQGNWFFEPN